MAREDKFRWLATATATLVLLAATGVVSSYGATRSQSLVIAGSWEPGMSGDPEAGTMDGVRDAAPDAYASVDDVVVYGSGWCGPGWWYGPDGWFYEPGWWFPPAFWFDIGFFDGHRHFHRFDRFRGRDRFFFHDRFGDHGRFMRHEGFGRSGGGRGGFRGGFGGDFRGRR